MKEKAVKLLDMITDKVLSYRPKPNSKSAKKRKRKSNKAKREKLS